MTSDLEHVDQLEKYSKKKLEKFQKAAEKVQSIETELEKEESTLKTKQAELDKKSDDLDKQISDKKLEIADLVQKEAQNRQSRQTTAKATVNTTKTVTNVTTNGNQNTSTQNSTTVDKILNAAYSQLGVPYVWGGTTPNVGLDCSGLVQWCYAQAGISLPRLSQDQGTGPRISNPQPGDLVCYGHHIGIYVGNGNFLHAPHTGDVVKISKVYGTPWYVRWF